MAQDEIRSSCLWYQRPRSDVWILDLETNLWRRGPCLPSPVMRATAYLCQSKVIVSGGCALKVNDPPPSDANDQIYEYVPNTKVYQMSLGSKGVTEGGTDGGSRWEELLDLAKFDESYWNYALYAVIPTQVTLPSFRITKGKFVQRRVNTDIFAGAQKSLR